MPEKPRASLALKGEEKPEKIKFTKTGFICPHCKKEQTLLGQFQSVVEVYHLNLTDGESEQTDTIYPEGFQSMQYFCTECDHDIDEEIGLEIENHF